MYRIHLIMYSDLKITLFIDRHLVELCEVEEKTAGLALAGKAQAFSFKFNKNENTHFHI